MKKIIMTFLCSLVVIASMPVLSVYASSIIGEGKIGSQITYTLDDEGTLVLTGNGKTYNYDSASDPSPFSYLGYDIEKIVVSEGITILGNELFRDMSVTSVSLPSTLTKIGFGTFSNCRALKAISFSSGLQEIGAVAFCCCESLTAIKIPEGVTVVGSQAFSGCTGLNSVSLPNTLTELGLAAFQNCKALTKISIPKNVYAIGTSCFYACSNLKTIIVNEGVKEISKEAFTACRALESIFLPDSIENVGFGAFDECNMVVTTPKGSYAAEYMKEHYPDIEVVELASPTVTTAKNNGNGILVEWNEAEGATGYVIYRRAMKAGETGWTAFARWNNTKEQSYLDTKVFEGTKYQYGVKAYYGDDPTTTSIFKLSMVGPMSNALTYNKKPGTTSTTTAANTNDGIRISWTPVEGASGYVIYRRAWSSTTGGWTSFQRWNNTTSNEWTDTKVFAGTRYQYGIKAYYGKDPKNMAYVGSVGPLSTNVRITTRKITSLTAKGNEVTVKWDASSVFTGYQVECADNASFEYSTLKTVTDHKTTTLTIQVYSGNTYYVRVRSYHIFEGVRYYGAWSEVSYVDTGDWGGEWQ